MVKALGMVELSSIAKGYEVADAMLKVAAVDLIKAHPICPGKFIVMVAGDVGAVKTSVQVGKDIGGDAAVDYLVLPNLSAQIIPAIGGATVVTNYDAVGCMEFFSIAAAIVAADAAVKAANIALIDLRLGFAIGGKAIVTLTGDVSSVSSAVEAGTRAAAESGLVVGKVIIPRPHPSLIDAFL